MSPTDPSGICDTIFACTDLGEICNRAVSTTDHREFCCKSYDLPDSLIPVLPSYELMGLLTSCASRPMTCTMKSQQQASPAKGRASFPFPRATLVPCQARLEKVDAFTKAGQLASLDHSSSAEVSKGRRGEKSKLKLGRPIIAKVTNVTPELLSQVALA
ncbi:uncharacterized protein UDID_18503 [Ustilago sp. UG-2017a]|nr:uncharacterized protein UDID_18503 [Ustilago sp. UG-2017a]